MEVVGSPKPAGNPCRDPVLGSPAIGRRSGKRHDCKRHSPWHTANIRLSYYRGRRKRGRRPQGASAERRAPTGRLFRVGGSPRVPQGGDGQRKCHRWLPGDPGLGMPVWSPHPSWASAQKNTKVSIALGAASAEQNTLSPPLSCFSAEGPAVVCPRRWVPVGRRASFVCFHPNPAMRPCHSIWLLKNACGGPSLTRTTESQPCRTYAATQRPISSPPLARRCATTNLLSHFQPSQTEK